LGAIVAAVSTVEKPGQPRTVAISAEGLIGIGITIACLGLLGLLLGWAQQMRSVPQSAQVWFGLGAILAIAGIVITAIGGARKRHR
jgi:hypothetical protein